MKGDELDPEAARTQMAEPTEAVLEGATSLSLHAHPKEQPKEVAKPAPKTKAFIMQDFPNCLSVDAPDDLSTKASDGGDQSVDDGLGLDPRDIDSMRYILEHLMHKDNLVQQRLNYGVSEHMKQRLFLCYSLTCGLTLSR